MKKIIIQSVLLLILTGYSSLSAQWVKSYGGEVGESAYSGQQTFDGGYIVAGKSASFGGGYADIWVLKLTPNGDIEWERSYGEYAEETCSRIRQTNDGGYVLVGKTNSFGDVNWDIWVLKLAPNGDVEWEKSYGGTVGEDGRSICQTYDGGYIVIGDTVSFGKGNSDVWVLKLFPDGSIEWQKTYGGSQDDFIESVQQTDDGGYILAGETASFGAGGSDIWVLKLLPDGDVDWQKTYGGDQDEHSGSIVETFEGGYMLAGSTSSFNSGKSDIWVLKLFPDGRIEWQKAFDVNLFASDLNVYDQKEYCSVIQTKEGGYMVRCTSLGDDEHENNLCLIKIQEDGSKQWQRVYGGGLTDYCGFLHQTYDRGYLFGGGTYSFHPRSRVKGESSDSENYSDFWIFKVGPNGMLPAQCGLERKKRFSESTTDITPRNPGFSPEDTAITPLDTQAVIRNTSSDQNDFCAGQYFLCIWKVSNGSTDPVPGLSKHDPAAQVKVEALPDPDYALVWWDGGDLSGKDNPVTITMDSHKALKPRFEFSVEDIVTGCFIATAVYDSPSHPHVIILREFRDRYLMRTCIGRELVSLYYRYSPSLAEYVAGHDTVKMVARTILFPLVCFSFSLLVFGPSLTGLMLGLSIFVSVISVLICVRCLPLQSS